LARTAPFVYEVAGRGLLLVGRVTPADGHGTILRTMAMSQPPPTPASPPKEHGEEAWGEEQVPDTGRERRLELAVTVLLAWAALVSAWSAYEASRFSVAQRDANIAASALRIDSATAQTNAGQVELADTNAVEQSGIGDRARRRGGRERRNAKEEGRSGCVKRSARR